MNTQQTSTNQTASTERAGASAHENVREQRLDVHAGGGAKDGNLGSGGEWHDWMIAVPRKEGVVF